MTSWERFLNLHHSFNQIVRKDHTWKNFTENPVIRLSVNSRLFWGCCDRIFFLLPVRTPRHSEQQWEMWRLPWLHSTGPRCWILQYSSHTVILHWVCLNMGKMPLAVRALAGSLSMLPVFLLLCFSNVTFLINGWWFLSFALWGCRRVCPSPSECIPSVLCRQHLTLSLRRALTIVLHTAKATQLHRGCPIVITQEGSKRSWCCLRILS